MTQGHSRKHDWLAVSLAFVALAGCSSAEQPVGDTQAPPADELASEPVPYGFFANSGTLSAGMIRRLAVVKDFDSGTCRFELQRCTDAAGCAPTSYMSTMAGSCSTGTNTVSLTPEGVGRTPLMFTLGQLGTAITVSEGSRVVGSLTRERNAMTPSALTAAARNAAQAIAAGDEADFTYLFDAQPKGYYERRYLSSGGLARAVEPRFLSARGKLLDQQLQAAVVSAIGTDIELDEGELSRATIGDPLIYTTIYSNAAGTPLAAQVWRIQDGCDRSSRSGQQHYTTDARANAAGCETGDVQWQLYAYFSVSNGTPQLLGGDPYRWSGY